MDDRASALAEAVRRFSDAAIVGEYERLYQDMAAA